jgi:hypothetical protein
MSRRVLRSTDPNELSWSALCSQLLLCSDVATLQRWLAVTVTGGMLYRALRVHGRMNAVRRAQELEEIKRKCTVVRPEEGVV